MRTRKVLAACAGLLLAVLAVGCGKEGSPPVKGPKPAQLPVYKVDTSFRLPESKTWTKAKKRGYLRVGAKEDQPYLGEKDPATGLYSGFDIEIAKMMAASLGFDPKTIRFKTIASANRETALQNGQIDYYVGTYTINEMRKKLVGFAGPYFMAGQSLLVRTDEHDINGPQDLAEQDGLLGGRFDPVPADRGRLPEGDPGLLRHVLDLCRQPADLPGRRRHHRRRHPAGLRRQGTQGAEGGRQAVLRGAVRHRGTAQRQRASVRTQRRP